MATPVKVGGVTLANRFVMGSMHTGLEGKPEKFGELARFYAERAKGGAALIVTGGYAPNHAGRITDHPCTFCTSGQVPPHRLITQAVHDAGGTIILQILHAGRYGYHNDIVAPSPIRSPINRDTPRQLSDAEIEQTISDYARSATLALEAGYDGVEIMGSEGYLISQFLAERTNHRDDEWGGSFENRMRFAIRVTEAVKAALGNKAILSFRMSALDLIDGGMSKNQTLTLAKELEAAGASCLSTGIGWHEATIPTIAGTVPHAAFADASARIREKVDIPVTASNRINLPDTAETLLASGACDLVSMARPFLADADFVTKALAGDEDRITICMACNQACLDHYFTGEPITCVVNPRAGRETEFDDGKSPDPRRIAIVGSGVAGIACALEAARKGHHVTLFERGDHIGGQLALAARVPGKRDYGRTIDSLEHQIRATGIDLRLNTEAEAPDLNSGDFDDVVIATGIRPRPLELAGADHPSVVGYTEALNGTVEIGDRVVVIGGGGIGHDVALTLAHPARLADEDDIAVFNAHWGVEGPRQLLPPARRVTMLQRTEGRFGRRLGKSTGWILRQELKDFGVTQIAGVSYQRIDDEGLHIRRNGDSELLQADTIVVCAGQTPNDALARELGSGGLNIHIIGGARLANELDAKRAMAEGARLGNRL